MNLLIALGVGALFGVFIQRAGASRYDRILGMLRLRDLTILKFMLLAIGTAAVAIGVLAAFGLAHFSIKPLHLWGVAAGGAVFGVGFALSGYCPGTTLVACAEGKKDAWVTVAGGLLGALAYTLAYPLLKPLFVDSGDLGRPTVSTLTGMGPSVAGVLVGGAFIALAFALPKNSQREPSEDIVC